MAGRSATKYPCIYHNNGWLIVPESINKGIIYFDIIKKKFFNDKSVYQKFKKPKELDIILCSNSKEKSLAEKSLEYLGIYDYRVLGREVIFWKNILKIQIILDYLGNNSSSEFILHLDSLDTIICENPNIILDRFLTEFNCEILFNAEKNSSPSSQTISMSNYAPYLQNIKRIEEFEMSKYKSAFKYLNSGCFIGRRKSIIEMFKQAVEMIHFFRLVNFQDDDQILLRELHRKFYPRIMIDDRCRIFQAMCCIRLDEVMSRYSLKFGLFIFYINKGISFINHLIMHARKRIAENIIKLIQS